MKIKEVNIEDVYPFEDEYGNQFLSRDYSTKENKRYVHELARSMAKKGIPDEPVQLVAEGGIYRIKSGNSRVMAMRELGTKKFPAIVYDEDDLVESIETVIRTNVKKKYEAVEESRFVQQLAMFADDEYVAETSGLDVEHVRRIRKGRDLVDDAAEDMSLFRLAAIGEFADDPEAVEELSKCTEKEYQEIAANLRSKREQARKREALLAALAERGVPTVEDHQGMRYLASVGCEGDIPDKIPQGCVASVIGSCWVTLYFPADEVDEDQERRKAVIDAAAKTWGKCDAKRDEWMAKAVTGSIPNMLLLAKERGANTSPGYYVSEWMKKHGVTLPPCPADALQSYLTVTKRSNGILGPDAEPDEKACRDYKALIDAMEADGFEPDEDEQGIYQQATDCLEAQK